MHIHGMAEDSGNRIFQRMLNNCWVGSDLHIKKRILITCAKYCCLIMAQCKQKIRRMCEKYEISNDILFIYYLVKLNIFKYEYSYAHCFIYFCCSCQSPFDLFDVRIQWLHTNSNFEFRILFSEALRSFCWNICSYILQNIFRKM